MVGNDRTSYHVLGETLGQAELVTLGLEVSDGERVFVGVPTGEALVGHIEEGVMVLLLDHVADLLPLLHGRIDPGGVVGTGMQKDNTSGRSRFEVGDHAIKVETYRVFVVIPVLDHVESGVLEDGIVVCPTRRWDVDFLRRIESCKEFATNPQCPGT